MVKIDKSVICDALAISSFHLNSNSVDPDYNPFIYPGKVWTWTYCRSVTWHAMLLRFAAKSTQK